VVFEIKSELLIKRFMIKDALVIFPNHHWYFCRHYKYWCVWESRSIDTKY